MTRQQITSAPTPTLKARGRELVSSIERTMPGEVHPSPFGGLIATTVRAEGSPEFSELSAIMEEIELRD